MGGLALKSAFTRRVNKEEFYSISKKLLESLYKLMSGRKSDIELLVLNPQDISYVDYPHIYLSLYQPWNIGSMFACVPRYFEDKDSFGDVDMLVSSSLFVDGAGKNIDIRKFIEDEFSPTEIYHNTNVWSFDVNECQVDFIITPHENMNAAYNYFSYNDLGNLMGRIAHKFDTKFGQDGLRYVMRGNGKIIAEFNLTKDIDKISEFLGLEPRHNFEDLEDIFNYVKASKYFNPFMYDMEHLNKINRDRNKKRKTYQAFLEYCEPLKQETTWYRFNPDKRIYLGYIEAHFPGFLKWYMEQEDAEKLRQECNAKFNGNIVMSLYDVSGKELGAAISTFNSTFKDDAERQDFILENDVDTIFGRFENCTGLKKFIYPGLEFGENNKFTVQSVTALTVTYSATGIEGDFTLSKVEFKELFGF